MIFKLLLFFCAYIPFQIALSPVEGIDLASLRLFVVVLFLLWIIDGFKSKKIEVCSPSFLLAMISFLFFVAFSLFFAVNPEWGLRKLVFLASFFPLCFVVYGVLNSERHMLSVLRALIFGGFLAAILGFFQFTLQFFVGIDTLFLLMSKISSVFLGKSFSLAVLEHNSWLVNIGGETVFRLVSIFPDPHVAAFYFGMMAFVSLGLFLGSGQESRSLYLVAFLVFFLADFLTFSRGGYIGALAGVAFFGYYYGKSMGLVNIKKILVVFLLVLTIVIAASPIRNRLLSSFNVREGSNSARIQTWKQSLEVSGNNLWTGVGLGNYSLEVKPSADWRDPIYSHNLYLDILSEAGIFALLAWMLMIFLPLKYLIRHFLRENNFLWLGVASGIIAFSVHSFFETVLFSVHILSLLIIFISIGILLKKEKY
jgi:O-antigen ligase